MRSTVLNLLLICSAAWAQNPALKPAFVAATIKLDPKADGTDSETTPGLLRAQMTLKHFITYAYDLKQYQVTGGPSWADLEHYAITAKLENTGEDALPADATSRQRSEANGARIRAALQDLLIERFQLKFHHETRSMPAYALTVAKGGFKLQEAAGSGGGGTNSKGSGNTKTFTGTRIDMGRFATFLSRQVDRPVFDHTEVAGVYTFTLDWTPDDLKTVASSDQPPLPSLFTILQEKLGLKLEPKREPVDIIVMDSAQRPPDN